MKYGLINNFLNFVKISLSTNFVHQQTWRSKLAKTLLF